MTKYAQRARAGSRHQIIDFCFLSILLMGLALQTIGNHVVAEESHQVEAPLFGISFPTKIGVFEKGVVTNNELTHSGLGYTIAYGSASSGRATIFVYDNGLSDIPDGPMEPLVRGEFDQATRDVLNSSQYFKDRRFELVSRYGTGTPDTRREFLCSEFLEHSDGGTVRSFLYVSGAKGKFVKLRACLSA